MKTRIIATLLGALALGLFSAGRAEACSRSYPVFFIEPGSTGISARGEEVLGLFLRYFRDREPADPTAPVGCGRLPPGDWKILVLAHADDPGTDDQCALSLARGQAVRARLVALGVPEASVAVRAFGDRRRMVPTPAGERDVANRRVELFVVAGSSMGDRLRDACPGSPPG